ncbi:zinc metalloproteinase nas-4-like isoform X2 [Palaemon carinicauda]|uniref:zinc metalloproteinase nas-4-like isoform X2 n=1 Tax=Palaemon carinicauda TaxID=392227 RepID=UPI0035B5CF4D
MASWSRVAVVAVILGALLESNLVCGLPSRSSDPEAVVIQENEYQYDPSNLPPLPLGQPDSIAYDTPGQPLNPDDFQQSPEMIHHDPVGSSNDFDPTMMAGLFQGDILLNNRDELEYLTVGKGKNAIIDMELRWPNGVIPYVISSTYSKSERNSIALAMKSFHENTCIRFVPREDQRDYIHILKGDGCSSSVGMVGGAQAVSLGPGCVYAGIAMHELMHAVGFWHEQSRYDRDDYIYVDYSNIQTDMDYNFKKYDWNTIQNLGVGYDLGSIMHYGKNAFAKDRTRPTIIPHQTGIEIGQRRAFSRKDIQKLELLYQCSNKSHTVFTTQTPPVGPTSPPAGCKDYHEYCTEWSAMGECTRNPAYMSQYCMKSCGMCDDETGVTPGKHKKCKDKNKHCKAWASEGQCRVNPVYMNKKCAKSCNKC